MTLEEMERHPVFRRALSRRNLYLVLLLVLELTMLAFLAGLHFKTHEDKDNPFGLNVHYLMGFFVYFDLWKWSSLLRLAVSVIVLIAFSYFGYVQALQGKGMISLYPEDRSKGQLFGSVRGPELVDMVQGLAKTLGCRRVDQIALTKHPDPNAYTARILGLGNVVVLHSNLLNILDREGVRSVLAHEIGHIRRKDSLLYQLVRVPQTAAWVIVLLNFVKVVGGVLDSDRFWEFLLRLSFLALSCWLVSKAFGLLERLSNLASQQTELMVDAYAAQVCGWDKHLNALLLMGERAELLTHYLEAVRNVAGQVGDELNEASLMRLLDLLPANVRAEKAIEAAAALYILDRLTMMREKLCLPVSHAEITDLAGRAAVALRSRKPADEPLEDEEETDAAAREDARKAAAKEEAERQQKEEDLRQKLLFWRDYDKDRSGHLDEQELVVLVEDLRQQPQRMIFREFLEPDAEWTNHPTTRHRILFLAELFAPGVHAQAEKRRAEEAKERKEQRRARRKKRKGK